MAITISSSRTRASAVRIWNTGRASGPIWKLDAIPARTSVALVFDNIENASAYEFSTNGGPWAALEANRIVVGLSMDTLYRFQVRALNSEGGPLVDSSPLMVRTLGRLYGWNPADAAQELGPWGEEVQASSGDGVLRSVRGIDARTTGKWYIEYLSYVYSGSALVGLSTDTSRESLLQYVGQTPGSIGVSHGSARLYQNSNEMRNLSSGANTGDNLFMVAYDGDAKKVYFGTAGVWRTGDPATGVGGDPFPTNGLPVRPMATISRYDNQVSRVIGNFGGTVQGTWGSLGPDRLPTGYTFWSAAD